MKNTFLGIAIGVQLLAACTKQTATMQTTTPVDMNRIDSTTTKSNNDSIYLKGTIVPSIGEAAHGIVRIIKTGNSFKLDLDSFVTTPGPDLHVYLSQESTPIHIIDLGNLQATSGYQRYTINVQPDFTKFKYATIHCQQYNVVFGYAPLQ